MGQQTEGKICFAVDVGGSSIKTVAARYCNQRLEVLAERSVPNLPMEEDGHVYVDVAGILRSITDSVQGFAAQGIVPDLIGIDTYGNCYTFLDEETGACGKVFFYKDQRTSGILSAFREKISLPEYYRQSGVYPTDIRVLMQLFYEAIQKTLPVRGKFRFMMLSDLLVYQLTGCLQAEESINSVASLLDATGKQWNYPIFRQLGIAPDYFLPLIRGGTACYPIKPEIAGAFSNEALQLACVTSHDTEAALLAAPQLDEHALFASIGTSVIFGAREKSFTINDVGYEGGFKNMKGPFTNSFCRDYNAMWLIEQCLQLWRMEDAALDYTKLMELCESAPENHTYLNVCDQSLRLSGCNIIEKVLEYCRETGQYVPKTRGEIANCIYESIVLQALWSYQKIQEATGRSDYHRLVCIGGGIRNSRLMQQFADALQLPVLTGSPISSSLGNMLMQLYSAGILKTPEALQEAACKSCESQHFTPHAEKAAKWNAALQILNAINRKRKFWR